MIFLFLGFPSSWDKIIALVSGLLIIVISYRTKSRDNRDDVLSSQVPYIEHKTDVSPPRISDDIINTH